MPAKKKTETPVPAEKQEVTEELIDEVVEEGKQEIEHGSQNHDYATFNPTTMELTLMDNDLTGECWKASVVKVRYPTEEEQTVIQGKKKYWQPHYIAVEDPTQVMPKPASEMSENEVRAAKEREVFIANFKKVPTIQFQWVVVDTLNGVDLAQACYPRSVLQKVKSIANSVRFQQRGGTKKATTTTKAANGARKPAVATNDGNPE